MSTMDPYKMIMMGFSKNSLLDPWKRQILSTSCHAFCVAAASSMLVLVCLGYKKLDPNPSSYTSHVNYHGKQNSSQELVIKPASKHMTTPKLVKYLP